MTQKELNKAIETSISTYGREATIQALNAMFHSNQITAAQCINALDIINR